MANVVLEQTLGTIVGETLSQLNDGDEESSSGQVLSDTAQSALLVLVGLLAIRSRSRLGVGSEVLLLDSAIVGLSNGSAQLATSKIGSVGRVGTLVQSSVKPNR